MPELDIEVEMKLALEVRKVKFFAVEMSILCFKMAYMVKFSCVHGKYVNLISLVQSSK